MVFSCIHYILLYDIFMAKFQKSPLYFESQLSWCLFFNFLLKAICFQISDDLFFNFLLTYYLFLKFFDWI